MLTGLTTRVHQLRSLLPRFGAGHVGPATVRHGHKQLQLMQQQQQEDWHGHKLIHTTVTAQAEAGRSSRKIAIVGGGLGGLTAARVLQQHGLSPVVFEREPSQESREQGGVLDLHPGTGQWALEQAGLFEKWKTLVRPEGQDMRILDKEGAVLWEEVESTQMDRPEIDRPVLRQMLLDSLQEGTVKWDHHMTALTPLSGGSGGAGHMLKFSNGHSMAADIVIGADGGRSKVRCRLTDTVPIYGGATAIELTIPDVDRSHPEAAKTVGQGTFIAIQDNKGFIAQRQGNGRIRVYVLFRMKANSFADLGIAFDNPAKTRQAIVDNFDGWAPEITNIVQSCDNTFRKWPCYGLPVGLTWASQPAITLLGDAAHLMPPFGGGGGNVAMEDAAQLALALVNNSQTADAIAAYEKNMFERAERAAQESADGLAMMVSSNGSHQFAQFMESVHQQPMPGRS